MKKSVIVLLVLAGMHCSTARNYIVNRAADTAEVFTLAVEEKVAGATVRSCFTTWGAHWGSQGRGWGLRAGTWGGYHTGSGRDALTSGNSYLLFNSNHHYPKNRNFRNGKNKRFHEANYTGFAIYQFDGYNTFTQCEVSLGLYYGLRFGFNLAEFADWFIGFTTIDILGDDFELDEAASR